MTTLNWTIEYMSASTQLLDGDAQAQTELIPQAIMVLAHSLSQLQAVHLPLTHNLLKLKY